MAMTDVQIVNLGLSKIASARISRINPPRTSLEQFIADNYKTWKQTELTKRRWVCALEKDYPLTLSATLTDVCQPYKYALPANCLRPVRGKYSEWKQSGRFILSAFSTLKLDYIKDILEADMDPLLYEVIACKVAVESCEYVTQSNTKKADAKDSYKEAVSDAAQANAFVMGPEDTDGDDCAYPWLADRFGGF